MSDNVQGRLSYNLHLEIDEHNFFQIILKASKRQNATRVYHITVLLKKIFIPLNLNILELFPNSFVFLNLSPVNDRATVNVSLTLGNPSPGCLLTSCLMIEIEARKLQLFVSKSVEEYA